MKDKTAAPSANDPVQTAQTQAGLNKDTAIAQANLNMVNQYTPGGSLEYSQRGTAADGTPQYSATQTLTPQQQRIFDLTQNASEKYGQTGLNQLNAVSGMLSSPFNLDSFGAAPTYDAAYRDQMKNSLITRNQAQQDRQRQQIETTLANQGITAGSQAYNDAFQPYYQGVNDFNIAAELNAGNLAGAEYGRTQQARQNMIGEALLPRQQSLNELAALAGGTQLSTPSYVNTPQTGIANTDIIGANGQNLAAQNAAYQAQTSQNNAMMGGAAGLGGAALMSRFWK